MNIQSGSGTMSEVYQINLFENFKEELEKSMLSVEDFRARVSQLLENDEDLTKLEVLSFLKLQGSHLFSNPSIYSLRMSRDSSITRGGGDTFETVLRTLDELGYNCEWQLLNSKDFGVPQNRERVFIIGHLRESSGREVFPLGGKNTGAIKRVVNGRETHGHSTYDVFGTDGISPTLKTMQGGNLQPKIVVNINPSGNGMNGNVYDSERLAPTLTTNKGEGPKIAIPVLTPDRSEKRQNGRRFKEEGEPMFTLTAQDKHGVAIIQKSRGFNKGGEYNLAPTLSANSWHENNLLKTGGVYTNDSESHNSGVLPGLSRTLKAQNHDAGVFDGIRIRRLTPRECWRLQGFPDWAFDRAQEVNSDSQLYKQAGNSVTVNVIFEIARRLR